MMSLLRLFLHNARVSRIQIRHILSLFHETHLQYRQIRTHLYLHTIYTQYTPTKLSDRSKIFPFPIPSSFSVFATSQSAVYVHPFLCGLPFTSATFILISPFLRQVILRFPLSNFQRVVLFLHCSFLGT